MSFLRFSDELQHNAEMCQRVRTKIISYLDRAEEIKALLKSEREEKQMLSAGEGTEGSSDAAQQVKRMQTAIGKSILVEKPNVSWDQVAGLEGAKEALKEAVIMPSKFPHLFKGLSRWVNGWMRSAFQLDSLRKLRAVPIIQVSASPGVEYSSSDHLELASHTSRRPSPTKRRVPPSSPYPAVISSASGLASRNGKAS